MNPTAIEPMAVARLRPSACNARTHSKRQVRQIANSIARFGFTNPILVDGDNNVIAGHGRLEAAKLLGLQHVPTLRLSGLDATQRRAYALADNKLALNAGWDRAALALELRALVDVQFDVEVTGFSCAEIEVVLDSATKTRSASAVKIQRQEESAAVPGTAGVSPALPQSTEREKRAGGTPAVPGGPPQSGAHQPVAAPAAVTRPDDMWRIERHRLLCVGPGDLTAAIERLLDGERLVFLAFEPALCDRIAGHFRELYGYDATLAETGQDFTTVAAQRRKQSTKEQS
jgi:ParB-like nuclease family protein